GLLYRHPLGVPASPSLKAVRALIGEADLVIAAGTEFGPTDYDMYGDGGFLFPTNLVRIDVDQDQLSRHPATVSLQADSAVALAALGEKIEAEGKGTGRDSGAQRAYVARQKALAELDPTMRGQVTFIEA